MGKGTVVGYAELQLGVSVCVLMCVSVGVYARVYVRVCVFMCWLETKGVPMIAAAAKEKCSHCIHFSP